MTDDISIDVDSIISGHKSLRERASEAYQAKLDREAAAINATAEDLKAEAVNLMISVLELHPNDTLGVHIERGGNTTAGQPTVIFKYDGLTFRVSYIEAKVMEKKSSEFETETIIDNRPSLAVRRPLDMWMPIKSLADLGKALMD